MLDLTSVGHNFVTEFLISSGIPHMAIVISLTLAGTRLQIWCHTKREDVMVRKFFATMRQHHISLTPLNFHLDLIYIL